MSLAENLQPVLPVHATKSARECATPRQPRPSASSPRCTAACVGRGDVGDDQVLPDREPDVAAAVALAMSAMPRICATVMRPSGSATPQ